MDDKNVKITEPLMRQRSRSITPNRLLTEQIQLSLALNDSRKKFSQNLSLITLLIVNLTERIAYYGLICNYVLYLNKQPLYWESYNASTILLVFLGITYVSSLIGGWIADSFLGKFYTIIISYFIYIIGYATFPFLAYDENHVPGFCNTNRSIIDWIIITGTNSNNSLKNSTRPSVNNFSRTIADESCSWIIIITVVLIGIAVGFIKANLGPFGADQVMSRGQTMIFKYFNWLYWCINLGSLFSFSFLAYYQQNHSFFIGFLIPFSILILSFFIFLCGSSCYIKQKAEVSVMTNIFRVLIEAFKSAKRRKNLFRQQQRERALLSESDNDENDENEIESESGVLSSPNNYYSQISVEANKLKSLSWLDNAKIRYGGQFDDDLVEDVKSLKKILILFAILVPYWIVYLQIETTYVVQGLHMKLKTSTPDSSFNFMIPTAWLSISDQVTVLIMIPFLDSLIYPLIRRRFKNNFCENTRLLLGMSFSAMSVILAGFLETYRLDLINQNREKNSIIQIIDNTTYIAADLLVEWQLPQYTLVGLGEVFCSVSCIYYAYSASPKSMQSIIMGLFYFFTGIGSFLGGIIINSFKSVIYSNRNNDDINCSDCHLNYYFFSLAAIQLVGMIVFIIVDLKYKLVKLKEESTDSNINGIEPFVRLLNGNNNNNNRMKKNYGTSNQTNTDSVSSNNLNDDNNQNVNL